MTLARLVERTAELGQLALAVDHRHPAASCRGVKIGRPHHSELTTSPSLGASLDRGLHESSLTVGSLLEDQAMEFQGYASKLSTVAPVPKWWARWWLRRLVWPFLHRQALRGRGKPSGVLLHAATISSAGWSIFDRIPPDPAAQHARPLARPYLLFEANYSGSLPGYLEAFSFVDCRGLRAMWQAAYDFPSNPGKAGLFYDFVDTRKMDVLFHYSAYRGASTAMVRAAIELQSRIDRFDRDYGQRPAAEFQARWIDFLTEVQVIRDPEPQDAGQTCTFTAVTAVDPDATGALKKRIAELPKEKLGLPRRTHFATLALEDQLKRDDTGILVFSTVFDGVGPQGGAQAIDPYLEALHERLGAEDANAIWGGGVEFEGPSHFRSHLKTHELPTEMPFASYPGRTVLEIREALGVAKRFAALVSAVQGRDPATLKRNWDQFRGRRAAPARAAWAKVA